LISRVVVYISRTLGDGLSLYILYPLGSTVLSAWTSIFWMLTGGTAVLRCRSLLGCNRHIEVGACVFLTGYVPGLVLNCQLHLINPTVYGVSTVHPGVVII
jgi:hypothetical protein